MCNIVLYTLKLYFEIKSEYAWWCCAHLGGYMPPPHTQPDTSEAQKSRRHVNLCSFHSSLSQLQIGCWNYNYAGGCVSAFTPLWSHTLDCKKMITMCECLSSVRYRVSTLDEALPPGKQQMFRTHCIGKKYTYKEFDIQSECCWMQFAPESCVCASFLNAPETRQALKGDTFDGASVYGVHHPPLHIFHHELRTPYPCMASNVLYVINAQQYNWYEWRSGRMGALCGIAKVSSILFPQWRVLIKYPLF